MKHLIDYTTFKLNEGVSTEKYQKVLNKVVKDLKLNLYMITSFGLAFTAFFPIVEELIKNEGLTFSTELVVIISICALSIAMHENVEQIEKLRAYAKEKGVLGLVNKIVNVLKGIKTIFPRLLEFILRTTQEVVVSIVNIFSYTAMFVPFMKALLDLIQTHNITAENLSGYLITSGIGMMALAVKNIITELFNKVREKIKKKFGNKSESVLIEGYKAIFS